ncbi:nitroreductase family protein [Spiroplasma taiwanense]|uniref:Nitroreductase n=1 Tax=Spiroplasma taiwanense CT-1 TaxID=1276220 RepID=S5MAS1_9MOLU|nr:nitroreductase family protein [Spiroplasma taiwanense]AGR40858.1 nitroreductase [Spiroplasma taiwanense CT-1]
MTKSLELLKKRRSAKRFVNDFKIDDSKLNELLESIRMAPSSFGMEPFRVIYIENKEIRDELFQAWWNQVGITQATGLLIWVGFKEEYITKTLIPEQNQRNIPEQFANIRTQMVGGLTSALAVHGMNYEEWSARQTYISVGTVLNTAEELGIDLCPSEGFDPNEVAKVLEKHNLIDIKSEKVMVGSFVGKVDTSQDFHHFFEKTRKPMELAAKVVK